MDDRETRAADDFSEDEDAFGAFLSYVATYRSPAGEEQRLLFAESLEQAHSLACEQAPPGWMLVEVRPNMDLD